MATIPTREREARLKELFAAGWTTEVFAGFWAAPHASPGRAGLRELRLLRLDQFRNSSANETYSRKRAQMGRPVIHFEVRGKDGDKLRSFYAQLFDWKIDADNPLDYGFVQRETNFEDVGIGGGIGGIGEGVQGHLKVTRTSRSGVARTSYSSISRPACSTRW